ncbi:MAG: glycosyltransferase [Myxococcales bacterium]|nr:glycosyltransferase [Myxococcales bacterium]MCB9545032.1 glycosyltransferase [Myxococcales bacterium]
MIGTVLAWTGLGVLALSWARSFYNLLRGADRPPAWTLDPGTPPDPVPDGLALSIVVPARNEAANIERCVTAALAVDWPGPIQVVVVDDRSTDGTGDILARLAAADPRLVVVGGADPPEGWLGKPHALHLAQQHATGDWLLFVDADVTLEPQGPRLLVGRTLAQEATMASGLGRLEVETFWERVVQTRIGAVIAGGNPLAKVNDPDDPQALANGQCLLFARSAYDALGGHEAIKGSVLDDVDFAKRAKAERVPYRLFFAPGVFRCRMYTGFKEIWNGWTKNLFPALGYSVIATLIIVALLFASTLLPFVLVAKNLALGAPYPPFLWAEIGLVGLMLATDAVGHRANGYRWGLFWTFPLGMAVVLGLFLNSAWRIKSGRGAVWKGRVVEARPRK